MRAIVFTVCCSSFVQLCCREPINWESRCIGSVNYYCSTAPVSNYFSAIVNGSELCFATGVDGYAHSNAVYRLSTTPADNPAYDPLNPPPVEGLFLKFILAKVENGFKSPETWSISLHTPVLPVDSFIIEKELDKLNNTGKLKLSNPSAPNCYEFHLSYSCYRDNIIGLGDPYQQSKNVLLSHHRVTQPVDAYIKVASFYKEDFDSYWKYDITFEMQLRLYYLDEVWKEFGDLDQGVFKTTTIVPK